MIGTFDNGDTELILLPLSYTSDLNSFSYDLRFWYFHRFFKNFHSFWIIVPLHFVIINLIIIYIHPHIHFFSLFRIPHHTIDNHFFIFCFFCPKNRFFSLLYFFLKRRNNLSCYFFFYCIGIYLVLIFHMRLYIFHSPLFFYF